MKTVNVGLIGGGFMARTDVHGYINLHLYYDPVPVKFRLRRICHRTPQKAEHARKLLGLEEACTDFRQITESADIDVVHICTPNHLHREELLSAIAHNKHIYCHKPLVVSMAEAEEVRKALPAYQATAQMVFHTRFFPAIIRARQLTTEGFVGRVLAFRGTYLHSSNADPEAPLKWKLSRQAGGGVINDLGSHILDLVHMLAGDYESICCTTTIAYPDRPALDGSGQRLPVDAEDAAHMMVRLPGGGAGTLEASKLATGTQDELRFEIHGEEGAMRFNLMYPNWLEIYDNQQPTGPTGGRQGWQAIDTVQRYPEPATGFPGPKCTIGWLRAHLACLHNFLAALSRDEPAQPGLEQGIYIQRVMEAAHQSDREGKWIDLK